MSLSRIFDTAWIPVDRWAASILDWVVHNFRFVFQSIKQPFAAVLTALQRGLIETPQPLILILIVLVAWQIGGRRIAAISGASMLAIGLMGVWTPAMTTLSIVLTCLIFCALVGIPLGILSAMSDRFWAVLRPLLDLMQTIPSFVYLVPIVMLFSIGNVSGVIVTFIYALAPIVRLTNLGIRQAPAPLVEAAVAFGASPWETLYKVQLPLAMPTIMAGVNQTVMLALSMTVVSSMISVTGLGQMVLRGIGQLDMGLATVGGLGIVSLAIMIDRVSQSMGLSTRARGHRKWYKSGPVGQVFTLMSRR